MFVGLPGAREPQDEAFHDAHRFKGWTTQARQVTLWPLQKHWPRVNTTQRQAVLVQSVKCFLKQCSFRHSFITLLLGQLACQPFSHPPNIS
eukprot:15464026-Alexandrium_andersonii.AAC.1